MSRSISGLGGDSSSSGSEIGLSLLSRLLFQSRQLIQLLLLPLLCPSLPERRRRIKMMMNSSATSIRPSIQTHFQNGFRCTRTSKWRFSLFPFFIYPVGNGKTRAEISTPIFVVSLLYEEKYFHPLGVPKRQYWEWTIFPPLGTQKKSPTLLPPRF